MKEKTNLVTDEIPEKIYKSLHMTYFIVKCLVIGSVFFIAVQLIAMMSMTDNFSESDDSAFFMQHNYCGTFFIEHNAENSYI